MVEFVYSCDATGKKMSDAEVQESEALRKAIALEHPEYVTDGIYSNKCIPFVEEYFRAYNELLAESRARVLKHRSRFFQKKLKAASEG